jgi:LCP family protein required for cell wall assembly
MRDPSPQDHHSPAPAELMRTPGRQELHSYAPAELMRDPSRPDHHSPAPAELMRGWEGGLVYGGVVSLRRSATRTAARALTAALLVPVMAACTSSGPEDTPAATSGAGSPGAASTTGPAGQTITGAPAELQRLLRTVYEGGDLGANASPSAGKALAARRPAAAPVSGTAKTGTWMGTPVAVVTVGKDVTLAVGPTWKVVGGWWPSLGVDQPSLGAGPRWVLAIGSDARRGQDLTHTRADTLQVVGIDGKGGGGVMGMARDLWVPLSTGGTGKINSAMVAGGPEGQLSTVRKVTGLPIEGYVVIGFDGFTKVIDEQGGIPIVVPERVNASHAKIVIEPGAQVLTGREALAYARERKTLPDGDFGRSRHQGEILLAAAIRAKLLGPIAIPAAMSSVSTYAKSNLTAEQMLTYAASFYQLNPAQLGRGVAKGATAMVSSQSVVLLGTEAKRLFASFRDGNLS